MPNKKTFVVDRVSGTRFELPENPNFNEPDMALRKWMADKDIKNMYYEYE